MTATRLDRRPQPRVWGRRELPAGFADCALGEPVGEIWYGEAAPCELLVKYLFTSDRLSIQVHPDDAAARSRGLPCGKDEAWLVLEAAPDAVIGLGLRREVSREALRAAALDGSIEELVDWRAVKAGDGFYSPAGTIHAIGGGLALVEIQQNADVTYRLYDYGRPRELHLDEAVAVAQPGPWRAPAEAGEIGDGRRLFAGGGAFAVERWTFGGARALAPAGELLLVPLRPGGTIDGERLEVGEVWRIEGEARLDAGEGVDLLAAYPGAMQPGLVART